VHRTRHDNRRVSFAPSVTQHYIDSPSLKRKRNGVGKAELHEDDFEEIENLMTFSPIPREESAEAQPTSVTETVSDETVAPPPPPCAPPLPPPPSKL
jgi:hypothetical protein